MYRKGHISFHDAVMEFRGKFKDSDRAKTHNPLYVYARPITQDKNKIKTLNLPPIKNEFKQYLS